MRKPLVVLSLSVGLAAAAAACADDPAPGAVSPCETPAGPLLGCPPPAASAEPPTIEEACWRLVECGVLLVDNPNPDGFHSGDYTACVNNLRGDEFTAERLEYVLRCVDVSSCQDLAAGHCDAFGSEDGR